MSNPYSAPAQAEMRQGPVPGPSSTNVLAIISVILGGVSLLMSFVGIICCIGCIAPVLSTGAIVCGIIGLTQIKQTGQQGKGLCYAGIGMAVGGLVVLAIGFLIGLLLGVGGAMQGPEFPGPDFQGF